MGEQLHITHRNEYLRGRREGRQDAAAGEDYQPTNGGVGSRDRQRAYALGYAGGWDEGNPCANGTCDHLAHKS